MVFYLLFTLLACALVIRAIDWYPAHIEREEQAIAHAAEAFQAGDESAWQRLSQNQSQGLVLWSGFFWGLPTPKTNRWQALLAVALVLMVSTWSLMTYGSTLLAGSWMLFGWGLVTLALIDARTKLLPDALTLPLLWLGISLQLFSETRSIGLESSVWGAIAGYVPLWLVAKLYRLWRGRDGLGMGDLKLLAAIGAWSGAAVLPTVMLLSSVLALFFILMVSLLRRQADLHAEFPFGPWIVAAYLFCEATGFMMGGF